MRVMGQQRNAVVALMVFGVVSAVVVAVLGSHGSEQQLAFASVLVVPEALLGGLLLVRAGRRDGREGRGGRFRTLIGIAMLNLSLSAAVSAACQVAGWSTFPGPGDYLAILSVPLVVIGLAAIPKRSFEVWQWPRLLLEASMLASFSALSWWRLLQVIPHVFTPTVGMMLVVSFDFYAIAVVFISVLCDPSRAMVVTAVGGTLVAGTDLVNSLSQNVWGQLTWPPAAVLTLAWPVLTTGLLLVNAAPPQLGERAEIRWEATRYIVVSSVFLALVVTSVLTIFWNPSVDGTAILFGLLGMASLWGREMVRARQVHVLLGQLGRLAHRDPLTGIGNRRALEEELLAAGRKQGCLSLLTVDLDGFKNVNDQLGHSAGDRVLVEVARLVDHEARAISASAFRVGGDEFVVVSRADRYRTEEAAQRIIEGVELAALTSGAHERVSVGASVGVVHRELTAHASPQLLLADLAAAGTAMRKAKGDASGRLVVYDEQMASQAKRRATLENRLSTAVALDLVEVHFQPVVSVRTGVLGGVEALARWHDDVLGNVYPTEFVAVAEECALISTLGRHLLRAALEGAVTSGLIGQGLSVAVNVSTLQLRSHGFIDTVAQALAETSVPAEQLVLEVTESVFVRTNDPAVRTLAGLAQLGVRLSLDDFGTGYSSLGYLTRLPVSALKLDRSLTARLSETAVWAVARSVVDMAGALGLAVVVEGVETYEELNSARRLGADQVQGWYYSPALTAPELGRVLSGEAGMQAYRATS